METYKKAIIDRLSYPKSQWLSFEFETLEKIELDIQCSWDNWDDDIVGTYYTGEKPERPTEVFIEQWIENEDFEADGYDVPFLQEKFA